MNLREQQYEPRSINPESIDTSLFDTATLRLPDPRCLLLRQNTIGPIPSLNIVANIPEDEESGFTDCITGIKNLASCEDPQE